MGTHGGVLFVSVEEVEQEFIKKKKFKNGSISWRRPASDTQW